MSSEARKEKDRLNAEENEAKREAHLNKEQARRRQTAAALRIQAMARRRLAVKVRAELYAIARAPHVIRAERFDQWRKHRREIGQPGHCVSMLSLAKRDKERLKYPWVREELGRSHHRGGQATYFLSSLRSARDASSMPPDDATASLTSRSTASMP